MSPIPPLTPSPGTDADARALYDRRYRDGYMDFWARSNLRRIAALLRQLAIPNGARVLDFGCGTGVFSALLRESLPGTVVLGCDVSQAAVERASARHNDVEFFVLDQDTIAAHAGRFDFIFSHHVLEHVVDLHATIADLKVLLTNDGRMLHVLPCGNPGSLHHRICGAYEDGFDPHAGNRFFFEEPGHLRRLTADQLATALDRFGLQTTTTWFTNQHWGAILELSAGPRTEIDTILAPARATRARAGWVAALRALVLTLFYLRLPLLVLARVRRVVARRIVFGYAGRSSLQWALVVGAGLVALPFTPIAVVVETGLRALAWLEWRRHAHNPRGSEMLMLVEVSQVRAERSRHSPKQAAEVSG